MSLFPMRILRLLPVLALSVLSSVRAQTLQLPLDITAAKADPKTRIFDDNRNTVSSYIYAVLEQQTACCGNDAIYLEVAIRADGTTESAKALTGRNDCLKRSIEDILKDIRWDNAGKAQRFYFDLKPALPCTQGKNNQYVDMTLSGQQARRLGQTAPTETTTIASTEQPAAQPAAQPAQPEQPAAQPDNTTTAQPAQPAAVEPKPQVAAAKPTRQPAAQPKPAAKQPEPAPTPAYTDNTWADAPAAPATPEPKAVPARAAAAPKPTKTIPVAAIPGAKYVSKGDLKPDESHAKSHTNAAGPKITPPEYIDGEAMKAVYIKQELRKSGVCGLAHVLAEITVDKDGTVKEYRIFQANDAKVRTAIGPVITSLKYKPESVKFRQNMYLEVKADVECATQPASKVNLDQVDSYLQQTDSK